MTLKAVKNKGYVFSYINPDTDGMCSSIGYSFLKRATTGEEFVPVVFGKPNDEILFVLQYFGVDTPMQVSKIEPDSSIVIVDTHHKNQLPQDIPFENVIEILDHHPAGDIDTFPHAKIQNEKVGAVATLITEKIMACSLHPDVKIAGILSAAIISNTLNFSAPSTSERDKIAFAFLQNYVNINQEFIKAMFKTRSNISSQGTEEVLLSDYKEFTIRGIKIGISQLEIIDVSDFIRRPDLLNCIAKLKTSRSLNHFIFNGIDILKHISILVAIDSGTQKFLEVGFGARFENHVAIFPRILLRKTDFVPKLRMFLEND